MTPVQTREKDIYLMRQIGDVGPIKIGCSYMPAERLAALSAWSPAPLEILATFPGGHRLEHNIHDCLWRSHSHHEWFHPTDEVLSFVHKIIAGVAVEQAIGLKAKHRPKGALYSRPAILRAYDKQRSAQQ